MKIRIPMMIQDPATSKIAKIKPTEGFDPDREDFFLDGPITRRIAVLDFDIDTGALKSGAVFKPPPPGRMLGWFENSDGLDLYDAEDEQLYSSNFMQVSVFATVLKTMYLFEKKDTLGRSLTWAFDAPQLLVVPRAGKMANAYYHRDSNSLQFFSFEQLDTGLEIHTCLSRDIVAHETGHAIIDGIVPDLLDAATPQSLALHEALADITALLMAFSSHNLTKFILEEADGSIVKPSLFSTIAEEFGIARGHRDGLRNLVNKRNLNPNDHEYGVRRNEPHELSLVLSGALYNFMIDIHEDLKLQYAQLPQYANRDNPTYSASGQALADGAERFKRMVFRALDYLPPGEVSYADYGRALIAVDRVAFPDDPKMRNLIRQEFVTRQIVSSAAEMETRTDYRDDALADVNVPTLYESDWAAYEFANHNRGLLNIPEQVPFTVLPRLKVRKKYDYSQVRQECLFKVSWDHVEENIIGSGFPRYRRIKVGTTLALDWDSGRILARLTCAPPLVEPDRGYLTPEEQGRLQEYRQQSKDRDAFLRRLASEDLLKLGRQALGPDGNPLISVIQAEETDGVMRARSTAKFLHIVA